VQLQGLVDVTGAVSGFSNSVLWQPLAGKGLSPGGRQDPDFGVTSNCSLDPLLRTYVCPDTIRWGTVR
jgi:hypothetical protein